MFTLSLTRACCSLSPHSHPAVSQVRSAVRGGYSASCDVKEMSQGARGRSRPVIYSSLAGGMRSICRVGGGEPESHTAALGTAYFRSHHSVSCKQQQISPCPPLCVLVAKCTDGGGRGRDDLKSPTIPSKGLGGKQKQSFSWQRAIHPS